MLDFQYVFKFVKKEQKRWLPYEDIFVKCLYHLKRVYKIQSAFKNWLYLLN